MKVMVFEKGKQVTSEDFKSVESMMRSFTEIHTDMPLEAFDNKNDDIDNQFAKYSFQVIIKLKRKKKSKVVVQ